MQTIRFEDLGLSDALLAAVSKMGFETPSPIQQQAIPVLLSGKDVVGQSQTGTGKTAAFAIPAIERTDPSLKKPQVLILCPTRELAVQVATEVAKLAAFKTGVRELPIYGGQAYDRQIRGLREGAQIIIGTPGRVIDHLSHKSLRLDQVHTVILDEADRMLDMGFCEDMEQILAAAPADRQTVFFSATLPAPIRRLIEQFSQHPESVRVEAKALTVPKITQEYYEVDRRSKLDVLCRLIDVNDVRYGIIFCSTKVMVDDLTEALLARGYAADKIHGDVAQTQRERVIERFRQKQIEFLIATDVAARGLDIDDVEVVFNYDLPHDGEDYVHRIGRTGRAGREGRAITFVAGREIYRMQNIVRYTKAQIRRMRVPTIEEVQQQKDNLFFNHLRDTLEAGAYRRYDDLVDRLLEQQYSPTDIASALIDYIKGGAGADAPRGEEADEAPVARPKTISEPPAHNRPTTPAAPAKEKSAKKRADAPTHQEKTAIAKPIVVPTAKEASPPRMPEAFAAFAAKAPEQPPAPGMLRITLNVGRDHQATAENLLAFVCETAEIEARHVKVSAVRTKRATIDVSQRQLRKVLAALEGTIFQKRAIKASAEQKKA